MLVFKKLLRVQIRHIVLVSIVMMIAEVLTSGLYYYLAIKNTKDYQSQLIIRDIDEARIGILHAEHSSSSDFEQYFMQLQKSLFAHPGLEIYLSPSMPSHAYSVSEKEPVFNEDILTTLKDDLDHDNQLTLSTYLSAQNIWVVFHARTFSDYNGRRAAMVLFLNLLIVLILWGAFLLYYRFTLPHEVLGQISAGSRDEGKSDNIVTHLKQQIQAYYDEKNLMLAALAHDIKTPLTEALLRLELLADESLVEPIKENLHMINNIVSSSLEYAKSPNEIKKVRVEIISLLESIVEDYQEKGFDASLHSDMEECELNIELQLFRRMIVNLLDNARKYASLCRITVSEVDGKVEIGFHDNGPGVPDEALDKLSTPFFRVDKSRSSQTGGTGLGLAIVKKVAQMHDGVVEFANRPEGGFTAVLQFPLAESESSIA